MPSTLRDPKTLADWLDLDYFRRARRNGRAWKILLGATFLFAVVVVFLLILGRPTAFQSRSVSTAHASFNQDCAQCHVGAFRTLDRLSRLDSEMRAVPDSACVRCHAGPVHHVTQIGTSACASCHKEHRGHDTLARVADGHCTECHADLHRNDGQEPSFDAHVRGFAVGLHPEFRLLAHGPPVDPGTVRFNHAVHLSADGILEVDREQRARQIQDAGGNGPAVPAAEATRRRVHLECQSCHQSDSAGRYMQPIRYEQHCQSCHPLAVQLVGEWKPPLSEWAEEFGRTPAPHPTPGTSVEMVRGVLRDRLARFIRRSGDEKVSGVAEEEFGGLLGPPSRSPLTREQFAWVNDEQTRVERLLFDGAGGCRYCHQEKTTPQTRIEGLPEYLAPNIPSRWLKHASFNHQSHQMLGCGECHPAQTSTRSADVLLPGIDTCRKCHGTSTGQARADCVECHSYHDHGGRAEFRGRLMIEPQMNTDKHR